MSARYSGLHPNDDAGHAMYEEQHSAAPDPNPYIPCAGCEERFKFEDYWKPRYVNPDDANPQEDTWLCDDCKEHERRGEANHAITEWVA